VALSLTASSGARGVKEGGTFRTAVTVGLFQAIDPALYSLEGRLLRPACGSLVGYPDKPLPEGLVLAPELAEDYPVISEDRKTYTFTIRKDARFSNGTPATAQAFKHALERMFTPAMESGASRALFKNNPQLRQAVNFAVDRRRLTREEGSRMGRATTSTCCL
jgi:ABC-type transport system substrate-binding protein